MPNKGHVTLDWQHSRGESRSSAAALPEGTPLLLLLSGIAGGSGDPYVQHLVADATDAGFKAANDALQLLGGYGYLAEYGIEKIVRDLRVHQILEGTNEIMRLIVARELVGR